MRYKLKPCTLQDLDLVMHIENSCFVPGAAETRKTISDRMNMFLDGFALFVDNQTGRCIGYMSAELWKFKDRVTQEDFTLNHPVAESHDPRGNEIHIAGTALLPEYHGQGLGKVMFQSMFMHLLPKYPNVDSSILIVSETWVSAIRIYEKNGFKEILRCPKFFKLSDKNTADGIVMRCMLAASPLRKIA